MLGKLLKYELKWIYKGVIIFYILGLLFSVLGRAFSLIENSLVFNIIAGICKGTAVAMVVNVLINNLMRVWARFHRNIYKDESYLTHTLPVSKNDIYLSKVLSAIISIFTSAVVIVANVIICYYSKEALEFIKGTLEIVASTYDSTVVAFLGVAVVVFFLEIIFVLLSGFIGLILGHKSNNIKMGKSVLYGFIAYIIPQILTLILMFILALFNNELMNLFTTTEIIDVQTIKSVLYYGIAIYVVYIIVYYFIGKKIFEKGVDVE